MGKVIHPREERSLSVREYARVQGFPDGYRFVVEGVKVKDAYKVIGNAVPPSVSYAMGIRFQEMIRRDEEEKVRTGGVIVEEKERLFCVDDFL